MLLTHVAGVSFPAPADAIGNRGYNLCLMPPGYSYPAPADAIGNRGYNLWLMPPGYFYPTQADAIGNRGYTTNDKTYVLDYLARPFRAKRTAKTEQLSARKLTMSAIQTNRITIRNRRQFVQRIQDIPGCHRNRTVIAGA